MKKKRLIRKDTPIRDFVGEEWVSVELKGPTKRNDYFISNYGRIKAQERGKDKQVLLKGTKDKRGYRTLNVRLKEGHQTVFIHKVVATYFQSVPSEEHTYVLHKDLDRGNNYYQNLVWASESEWKDYLKKREEEFNIKRKPNITSKLTESKVSLIKKYLKKNKTKRKVIARQFNVSETQIRRIEREENWANVPAAR